jgi:hypothetical protein
MEELCGYLMPALSREDSCLSRVAITDGCDPRDDGQLSGDTKSGE